MGSFSCPCGNSFKDYDETSYRARLIADMDFDEFWSAAAAPNPLEREFSPYDFIAATVYQCPACQRLLVMPRKGADTYTFVPEGHSKNLLATVKGVEWQRRLYGYWDDRKHEGVVIWGDQSIEGSDSGAEQHLKSLEEVQNVYFTVFRRLLTEKHLKTAQLTRYGITSVEKLHEWNYGSILAKGLKNTIVPDDLAAGNELVEVSYGECTAKPGDKKCYSITLRNRSSKAIRIRKFAGYNCKKNTWVLNTHGNRLYVNSEFMDWYNQSSPWIAPGEMVCDEASYGTPPVIWAYHCETDDGDSFIAGNIFNGLLKSNRYKQLFGGLIK